MQALVYHGPGQKDWTVQPTLDAYETFAAAGETSNLNVVLEGEHAKRAPERERELVTVA